MEKQTKVDLPTQKQHPDTRGGIEIPIDPEEPMVSPENDPDTIFDEEFYEPPAYETSVPGEGP